MKEFKRETESDTQIERDREKERECDWKRNIKRHGEWVKYLKLYRQTEEETEGDWKSYSDKQRERERGGYKLLTYPSGRNVACFVTNLNPEIALKLILPYQKL